MARPTKKDFTNKEIRMLRLERQGLTQAEIARALQTYENHVSRTLARLHIMLGIDDESLSEYRREREKHYTAVEAIIMKFALDCLADEDKQNKMSILQAVQVLEKVHRIRRLEDGESTTNTAINVSLPDLSKYTQTIDTVKELEQANVSPKDILPVITINNNEAVEEPQLNQQVIEEESDELP